MPPKKSDKLTKEMTVKMKVLDGLRGQAPPLLLAKNERQLIRLSNQIKTKVDEYHTLISSITELRLFEDDDDEEVAAWATEETAKLQNYDEVLEDIEDLLKELKEEEEIKGRRKLREEEEKRRKMWRLEEEERMEQQRKFELELEEKRMKRLTEENKRAKLPKLQITKFDGTIIDWVRFWEQFETEIDKSRIYAPITKLSYLRELLSDQPKTEIAGLPFSEEGYHQAKILLNQKYGVTSEIVAAHGRQILNLPFITSTQNLKAIHQFYRKLNVSVNSLKTLDKLDTAEILVRETLDKLGPIKADIIRTDPKWQAWKFDNLLESLRDYTLRNPETSSDGQKPIVREGQSKPNRTKVFQTNNKGERRITCVYCNNIGHYSSECDKVKGIPERKEILRKKKLCFNCTGQKHSVANCRSRNCARCNQRHHTSICTYEREAPPTLFMKQESKESIHPIVVAVANKQRFRTFLDTGSGSSYVSSTFINHTQAKPSHWENKDIETMTGTTTCKLPVYFVPIESVNGKYTIQIKAYKIDRQVLTTLKNPRITELKKKYPHLAGLQFENEDDKDEHPIHIMLGTGDVAKIKIDGFIRGKPDEPIAERTLFGWYLMGRGMTDSKLAWLSTNTSQDDYKRLYSLDVLGIEDRDDGDQQIVHQEFKEKLARGDDGRYSCQLPWKENHPILPNNKAVSIGRFNNLLKKLKQAPEILQSYHNIIMEQLKEGIIEEAPEVPTGNREYYMPHRAVIREHAESTKLRIVFDASSREKPSDPSLNDCLHTGPALQPLLQNILIRNRMKPVALLGDIKQAFLQIGIDEQDRDVFRFFWVTDLESMNRITLRMARLPFGCASSPFALGATLIEHLESYMGESLELDHLIQQIKDDLFVDDLVSGADMVEEAHTLKKSSIKVFKEGCFTLHKWHSNVPNLEDPVHTTGHLDSTYAKDFAGMTSTESKILGVLWDKREDTLSVDLCMCKQLSREECSKRGVLKAIASVYDPLGIASPLLLNAKNLYREICEQRRPWDEPLTEDMKGKWMRWVQLLPNRVTISRSLSIINEKIQSLQLHGFGDASKEGCCSAIYAVIKYSDRKTQGLLTAKSRISKKNLSIPRLELVAGHMVANSLDNVKSALKGYPQITTHAWLDSTAALYWIQNNNREWKQFVSNRVAKINKKEGISWRYCPTTDNPADIGSRGTTLIPITWLDGPSWLSNEDNWPENIVVPSGEEVDVERKRTKEILLTVTEQENVLTQLLAKHSRLAKLLRITAWMGRFLSNCKGKTLKGELTSEEIQDAMKFWILTAQDDGTSADSFEDSKKKLNIVPDDRGVLRCKGRISGSFPVFLPVKHQFTTLVVKNAHEETNHGLVSLTMAKVREKFWIERLRSQVKSIIHGCYYCKRRHCTPLQQASATMLPEFRVTPTRAFDTTGVDFAGPFEYRISKGQFGKAYIVLFTCASSRAVYLDLLKSMEVKEFKGCFKEFVARRGNPSLMISDNAKTFKSTHKWLLKIKSNAEFNTLLAKLDIKWKFNLSRSPWWGGMFERLVGMTKAVFCKSFGKARLSFQQLRDLLLEAETILNNRPLGYLEDDLQLPHLTPNMLVLGSNVVLPEDAIHDDPEVKEPVPVKMFRHLQKSKELLWRRWRDEYLQSLRERHQLQLRNKNKKIQLAVGDIVQVKGEVKNRGEWRLGVVVKVISKGETLLGAKLRMGNNNILERPLQHLYPLELKVDAAHHRVDDQKEIVKGDLDTISHCKPLQEVARPRRKAKEKAIRNIKDNVRDIMMDDYN